VCVCCVSDSVQLEKERQQRENAEKQKRDLEDRLRNYETEFEKAKLGEFDCDRIMCFIASLILNCCTPTLSVCLSVCLSV